ncbi:MAG: baseplate J/gp47 family protein [Oscillospiraceae bacterium]|nr:baseplate J/gp47 family protein [Oscillospiraceae bacterium]
MSEMISAAAFREAMVETYRQKSGVTPEDASDVGIRMSALASVLESLWVEVKKAEDNTFPQRAAGQALDLLAGGRGLSRKPALAGGGRLRFSRTTPAAGDIAIPAGIVCADVQGLQFRTTEPVTLAAGGREMSVPAAAAIPGEAGNAPAGTVNLILSGLPGISSVTNPSPFAGGVDEESDLALRGRLMRHISDPPTGFNAAFYREAALRYPGVRSVQVVPAARGIGSVDVIIAALPGYQADTLAGSLAGILAQTREIGVDIRVLPADIHPIDVTAVVRVLDGSNPSEVVSACERALAEQMAAQQVGQGIAAARLSGLFMEIPGVENVRLVSPSADIAAVRGRLLASAEIAVAEGVIGMPEVSAR